MLMALKGINMDVQVISHSLEDTKRIASVLANKLFKGAVITLDGPLGAGKTTFTQGVGLALGVKEKINSPTFNILKCYFSGKLPFYHIDAYRLEDNINVDIGLEEVVQGDGICLIEWSIYIPQFVFKPLRINIEIHDDESRIFKFSSDEEMYFLALKALKEM